MLRHLVSERAMDSGGDARGAVEIHRALPHDGEDLALGLDHPHRHAPLEPPHFPAQQGAHGGEHGQRRADDGDVQIFLEEQIEVGRGGHPSVDVALALPKDRRVNGRHRPGARHRRPDIDARRARRPERDPLTAGSRYTFQGQYEKEGYRGRKPPLRQAE